MFRRGLGKDDVIATIHNGQVIADYHDDRPYPSCLMLSFVGNIPLHVVFAVDEEQQIAIAVTAYVPDPDLWADDFKSRRNEL